MMLRSLGSGPDVALVHGWGFGSAAWEPVVTALATRCRVHLVDLPGYGTAPADSADFVQTAQALSAALPDGCALCGWSLGGLLALQAAQLAPQRTGRLILVGATPSFAQRANWTCAQAPALLDSFTSALAQDAAGTLQRFAALLNQGDTQARTPGVCAAEGVDSENGPQRGQFLPHSQVHSPAMDPEDGKKWTAAAHLQPTLLLPRRLLARTLVAGLQAGALPTVATLTTGLGWLRDVDLRAQAPAIATPTLLIHGAQDPLMPLAAAQWLARHMPDARLETFVGSAHAPFLADPQRFAALVGDFCHAPSPDRQPPR